MSKIFETVKAALVGNITELDRPYAADIHNHIYNEKQHYILYAAAKEAAAEIGTWECIGAVQTYEQDQFGEVYTRLSDAVGVVNMVVYILGEALLDAIYEGTEYFSTKWNEQLSDGDLQAMLNLAEIWFNENPEGLEEIWESLDI